MYLRRNKRLKNGGLYEYWTLVESVRTSRGPRQRTVATLGKIPGLDEDERAGWEEVGRLLDGSPRASDQGHLFRPSPEGPDTPRWAQVNLSGVRVERVREFGKVYVALALWRRLGLDRFLSEHLACGRERIDWATVACILSVGCFCAQPSELAISETWYARTALDDLLGVRSADVYDNRLYRGLDALLPVREALFGHLRARYQSLFGSRFEFLLYDITSTYFEGRCARNRQAQHGYSRDRRFDCRQVCIGLVVTPDGLPLAYEVFDGNRSDVTTVRDMVARMEHHYGQAERIWVMDRGMVSEENLDFLRQRQALYIVGTPKRQLRHFARDLFDARSWQRVESGVEVKLVRHPDGHGHERYILCRSHRRYEKEAAMLRRQRDRLRAQLVHIDASLQKRHAKAEVIERRIGKWLGRYTAAAKLFHVEVIAPSGWATGLRIDEDDTKMSWAQAAHGAYLLRTNCQEQDPQKLWRWYIQLAEIEDAFRTCKSDLGLRPIYHHRTDRVQAHIFVCFLALVMWRSLEMWLNAKGLGTCARQVLKELDTIRSMDVVLPIAGKPDVRLRVVGKPEKPAATLLARMQLKLPTRPKQIQNVVEKN